MMNQSYYNDRLSNISLYIERMNNMDISTEIRIVQPGEMIQAIQLADQTFRNQEQVSMGVAFPHIFNSVFGQSYGAFVKGQLVAFMGLVPSMIRVGEAKLNVYLLGSVCTDEAYRGQGLASEMLQSVLTHIDSAGASLLLVSGGRPLYRRAGCHPFGQSTIYVIDQSVKSLPVQEKPLLIREMKPVDWFAIHRLASARPVRFEQSVWELATLIEASAFASIFSQVHIVLIAEQEDGEIIAFAVISVSTEVSDSTAKLIEWAGNPSAIAVILQEAISKYELTSVEVAVPWYDNDLAEVLQSIASSSSLETDYHTLKIVNPDRLIEQLSPYFRQSPTKDLNSDRDLSIERIADDSYNLRLRNGNNYTVTEEELVSLLFIPNHSLTDQEHNDSLLSENSLPIPLPYEKGLNYV